MKVLVVEDEPSAAKRSVRLLQEIRPEVEVVGILETIADAVDWFKEHLPPDMVLMDVQLADGQSFAIFDQVQVKAPVVFTTAYDEFALNAFRVHAFDYLLKPLKKSDLVQALDRVLAQRSFKDPSILTQGDQGLHAKRFLIRYGDHLKVIEPDQVAYFHSLEKNTFVRTHEGKDLPMDQSLGQLEPQLDPERFFRLNRQLLINIGSIDEMFTYSKARVKVKLQPPYEADAVVSSERASMFKRWLQGQTDKS